MNIVKKSLPRRKHAGRKAKYPFVNLNIGDCLEIEAKENIKKLSRSVSASLSQWKSYNNMKWKTAVRVEGDLICVYRIS